MASVRPGLAAARRTVGIIVVLLILGGAVVFYRVAPGRPSSRAPDSTASGSSASQPTSAAPTPVPRQSPSRPVPRQSPATKVLTSKGQPGVTGVGVQLSATPGADGSFEVSESVILRTPVTALQLRVPPISDGGSTFVGTQPRATAVQISAGGQPVAVPDGQLTGELSLPLAVPASKVQLRYRLTGVTVRTPGSTPGRALAALGPVVAGVPANTPVAITVRGQSVLNLRCPYLSLGDQACSIGGNGKLRVNRLLPWQHSVIVIQFSLPRP